MNAPNFPELLALEEKALANQLRSVRASINHPGEKGRSLEQAAIALLRRILPAEYGIASGFIACARPTADGEHVVELSPQCDVVIYDAIRGGALVDLGESKVLPVECVHAAVEVKASLYGSETDLYAWSSKVRKLDVRHYIIDPERYVNPRAEEEALLDETIDAFDASFGRASFHLLGLPRQKTCPWTRIRCFAIAFEYGDARFSTDAAQRRLADAFEDPGHFHALFVPDECVLWNERADQDADRLGAVAGTTTTPLATFRNRLFDALSNFPRPSEGVTMDLRPYFGGYVAHPAGPLVIVTR